MKKQTAVFILLAMIATTDLFAQNNKSANPQVRQTEQSIITEYHNLLNRKESLEDKIDQINAQLSATTKKRTVKKLNKELSATQAEYQAILRRLKAIPRSVTDPEQSQITQQSSRDEFKQEMEEIYQKRIEEEQEAINEKLLDDVEDPSLRSAYEKYTDEDYSMSIEEMTGVRPEVIYTIQLKIDSEGMADQFPGIKNLRETNIKKGQTLYHVGSYATEKRAKAACDRLREASPYKEAYVVALDKNNKLLSLKAAAAKRDKTFDFLEE